VISDAGGGYVFSSLSAGTYTMTAHAEGFASQSIPGVQVSANGNASVDLKLQIETATQSVQVADSASDTSPQNNSDAIVIKGADLDMLSADNNQMLQQLQGVAGTGGDGSSPQLYVDGFSGGQMPPKNTIREIRINDNPFSAEYAEQGFNRIEIFTKPGTDSWHGEAFGFGTDSAFDSMNPFAAEPQPFHTDEVDADLNGPLGKKTSLLLGILSRRLGNSAIVNAERCRIPPTTLD
jgi:hypothetical protein